MNKINKIEPFVENVLAEVFRKKKLVAISYLFEQYVEFRLYSIYSSVSEWAEIKTIPTIEEAMEQYNKI